MPHVIFISVVLCGIAYVSLKKRKFDALSVAIFSQFLYFFPFILGSLPKSLTSDQTNLAAATIRQPVAAGSYWLATILVGATLLGAILLDLRPAASHSGTSAPSRVRTPITLEACLMLIAVIGLAVQWHHVGSTVLFAADKLAKMNHLGQGFAAFETGAALACILAFNARNWPLFSCALALLGLDIFIGFRYITVLSLVSIALLYLSRPVASVLLVASWRLWLPAIAIFLFFLNWPYFHQLIATGNLTEVTSHGLLLSTEITIRTFEPFTTQSLLNRVVISNFSCAPSHFFSLLTLVVPFGNLLGFSVDLAGSEIQQHLFPDAHYGIGSNIVAEMFCSFGLRGVVAFSLVFAGALILLSYGMKRTRGSWQAVIALEAVLFAFYIYRNDLYYLLLLARRVALLTIMGYTVQWMTREAVRRFPLFQKNESHSLTTGASAIFSLMKRRQRNPE